MSIIVFDKIKNLLALYSIK